MKLGLVGLPMSGKTTIFNALTGQQRPTSVAVPGKLDVQLAVVDVPDPYLDRLYEMFNPERKVDYVATLSGRVQVPSLGAMWAVPGPQW